MENLFEEFSMQFPEISKTAIDWYPSGQMEIIIKLSDGSKIIYDGICKIIKTVGKSSGFSNDEEWNMEFARRLYRRLQIKSMTIQELSEITGISRQSLSRYSNGTSVPTPRNITKMARALGCSPSELIDFD